MARRYLTAVLLASVWLLCCLPYTINAQSARGMTILSTTTVSSTYAQPTGYVYGSDSTNARALVAVGNNLFAIPYDNPGNMGTPIFQTIESDDQIIGAFFDAVNGSIFVCTRIYRRIYWLSNFNAQGNPQTTASIRNRGQTSWRFWNACALDSVQKGIWVAADTEVGYYKNVYQSGANSDYVSSDVYGSASYLKSLVIINGNVFLGGASGNLFVTSVSNTNVAANSITRITRGVGQIQAMDVSPSLNKIYIGGDLGVLTEIDASSWAFTRISFIDDASISSLQVDDTYGAVFLNAISRSTPVTSRIIRINLNDPNFDTFGVYSFPSGITVNTGDLDPRNNKFQMMYINTAGDTVSMVRTASCTDYTCTTCNSDTNYCGYCSTSRSCVTPTSCAASNFYTSTYVCPTLTSILPTSGSTDGGTTVTVTGQFTDPAGNTLNSGFECQWGTASRVSATVVNGATLRCTSPSASAGDTTFKVYYSGSLWAPNSLTFSYYSCSALTNSTPCTSCFTRDECGLCIPTMQCASQRGCASGFSTSCPVISNISPASASIVGNTNFTITIDKNINANYQCLYSSDSTTIANTPTPATLIRSNTLTCKPPTVTNWSTARGTNRELNVDLVLKVSTSSATLASKSKAIYLFDCDTYGQDCSGCTNSLTQGECAFCFDSQNCHYSSVQCNKTGTCPSISSVSPSRIYTGAVKSGQVMTITGSFAYLSGLTFYCAFNAAGDVIGSATTTGSVSSPTSITCTVHSSLGVGTQSVSLWLYSSTTGATSRLVPNFPFEIYDCTGTSCGACLDGTKPECVFCSASATCTHSSVTCANTKLTSSASCPSISAVAPTSVSKTGNATIVITGAFNPTLLSGSVTCLWSYGASTVITPATYSAANEVHCTAPAVGAAATGTVTLAYNGYAWTNSLPFLWYDCAQITGDCSKCITDVTPKCTWCTAGCDEVCSDAELKTDVCPSLTSVTPNYGYVLGGETVSVSGGPFFSRTNFTYECHFGDKVSPAVVESNSVLSCATPTSLLTQTVNLTIWMNGIIYAPYSSLQFTYYECQTFAQTSCNSFCMAQPHCGWCVASSSCTSASRCTAEDLFLTQCLTVTPEPNHMSIFGNSNVTLTFTPRLPDFLLLNSSIISNLTAIDNPPSSDAPVDAPVTAKRSLFQTVSEPSLLTCTVGGLSQVPAYITGLNTVACALPASGVASKVALGVLYKGSNLLTPIEFTYVDCETTSNCDDCSRKQYCGWCLQENSCSTLKRCTGDWADGGCPNLISITPDSASASGGASVTLVGEYFINHPSIKILMGKDAAEYEFINSTTMTVIVVPGTADESVDIEMMFDDKKYATNTLSFTWVSPFSVPGLAAGMSIAGALMIGGGVFYYLFTRYQKRRRGLFVQVKEPDYEKVAYQNEMVQHFRVTTKDDYVELEDILMNKDRTFLRILVAITAATEYDAVAKALVYLSHHKGIGSDLIQFFASDEVRKSTSENTIFRQNSMASKMFKFYSQIVGTRFLFFTLARVINELNTVAANAQKEKEKLEKLGADTTASLLTIEMEVDPNKLKDSNVDKDQNVYQLALACQKLFTAIAAADENVPAEFRQVFIRIQSSITEQYGDSEAIYKALGGFLFLRFVCPAITAPHYYGLLREPPNSVAQRQLVLIAKVLQNLANLANTKKEAFMESMLDFIERNKPKMIHYYKSLLNPEAKANPRMATNLSVPATVRENSLAYLHTHIYRNQQKIKVALTELPDQARARQLATLVDRIIEKYGEPPKRLKDKGGPVRSAPAEPIERPEPAAPKNVTINNPVAQVGEKHQPGTENNTNEANNNRPVANRPTQPQHGTARRGQFATLREPFFDIADAEPVGNLLEDNVFTDTIVITEANMFDNPFDINFEPMANELDFEVFDNPLLETNSVVDN